MRDFQKPSDKPMHVRPAGTRQQGFALFVGLIVLLVVTIVVVSAMRASNTDLLMSNNTQNANEAFASAENAAAIAEQDILDNYDGIPTFDFSTVTTDGYYAPGQVNVNSIDWTALSHETGPAGTNTRYVIEYFGPFKAPNGSIAVGAGAATQDIFVFEVTGHGESSKGSARMVRTVFATAE